MTVFKIFCVSMALFLLGICACKNPTSSTPTIQHAWYLYRYERGCSFDDGTEELRTKLVHPDSATEIMVFGDIYVDYYLAIDDSFYHETWLYDYSDGVLTLGEPDAPANVCTVTSISDSAFVMYRAPKRVRIEEYMQDITDKGEYAECYDMITAKRYSRQLPPW